MAQTNRATPPLVETTKPPRQDQYMNIIIQRKPLSSVVFLRNAIQFYSLSRNFINSKFSHFFVHFIKLFTYLLLTCLYHSCQLIKSYIVIFISTIVWLFKKKRLRLVEKVILLAQKVTVLRLDVRIQIGYFGLSDQVLLSWFIHKR